MKITTRLLVIAALFVLVLPLMFTGNAGAVVFNPDGLTLNPATGMWDLPVFGSAGIEGCYDGTATINDTPSPLSRFTCYNLQGTPLNARTTNSTCIATGTTPAGWLATVAIGKWASCSIGGYTANTTNALTDCATNGGTVTAFTRCSKNVVNSDCTALGFTAGGTATTPTCTTTTLSAAACAATTGTAASGAPYVGSAAVSGATTTCTIYIGNNAAACTAVGGGTLTFAGVDETRGSCGPNWIFKAGTVGDFGSSVRNNCTKCHNPVYMASAGTDFETFEGALVNAVRDAGTVSTYKNASHKNASRKIPAAGFFAPGQGLVNVYMGTDGLEHFGVFPAVPGGFSGAASNQIRRVDWVNGKIEDTTGGLQNLPTGVFTEWYWTFGYYGEDPERGVFNMETQSNGKPLAKQQACFKCHATGYVSPAALDTTKEPEKSFPGISWDGTTTYTVGSRPGVVNFATTFVTDRNLNTKTTNTYGAWDQYGVVCSRCHNAAGGSHTSGGDGIPNPSNGYAVNAVCGQCHIRASSSDWSVTAGTGALAARAAVGTGHPNWHETDFLNSPHARFSGTYGQVATSSMYNSAFGTVAGGGCTGCHNPHGSVREAFEELAAEGDPHGTEESLGPLDGVEVGCVDCHSVAQGSTPAITTFRHPTSTTKPTPWSTPDPCATCHMQGGRHLFRVTTDVNYTTTAPTAFPVKSDGVSTEAVWQDLKNVCQQCHSGHVEGIPFIQTADLRNFANGFHGATPSPEAFVMDFTYVITNLHVAFTASGCPSGDTCSYRWNFGDGSPETVTAGTTTSRDYTAPGTYSAQVIVIDATTGTDAAKAKAFTVAASNIAPTAIKTITQSGWVVNVIDASTDDAALPAGAVLVDWGNGTSSTGNAGTTLTKTYTVAGSYIIKHRVTDSQGLKTYSGNAQVVVPIKYTVSGSVMRLDGTTPVVTASIRLLKGAQVVKMTTTNASGNYTLNDVSPDSYTVQAVKSGLTFSSTPAAVVTNANVTGINITATR